MNHASTKKKFYVPWVLALIACFLMSGQVLAQTTMGTIEGTVTDEEGSGLPGATVTVRNVETGYKYSSISRSNGRYIISGIQPGQYEVEVTLPGFTAQIKRGITCTVGATLTINCTLAMAAIDEELIVTAESPMVEVTKSEIGGVVEQKKIDALPLLDRDWGDLTLLKAGTQGGTTGGQPSAMGELLVDGIPNEWSASNSVRIDIPADAIQEFRVVTNMFAAEFGNASGLLRSAITRSGTNDFRGRVSSFYRDEMLDTPNYFVNHSGYKGEKLSKDEYEKSDYGQYRYGGFFGGPIVKDKFHFFLAFENLNRTDYAVTADTALLDPATYPVKFTNPRFLVKLNYQLSERHLFSIRWDFDRSFLNDTGVGGKNSYDRAFDILNRVHDIQGDWTFYISDNALNEFRVFYSQTYQRMRAEGYEFCWRCDYPYSMPYSINRPGGNFGPHPGRPSGGDENRYQIMDNFSLFLGSHSLKFGFHWATPSHKSDVYSDIPGVYIFTTDKPFDADDASTYPRRFRYIEGSPYSENPYTDIGIFAQDSWKILPRLTLNIGFRYCYYDISVLDIADTSSGNFNARFGFSWDPVGDGKTSIRGGIGTFTANPPLRAAGNTNRNNLVTTVVIDWPGYPDPFQPNPFRPQQPGQTSQSEYTSKPGLIPAHSFQTTLGFQREVMTDLAVSADLVYSKTSNLWRRIDQNPVIPGTSFVRIDPTRGEVRTIDDGSRAEYKALMLTFNKRYAKGWAFELSYTLSDSKSMTEQGEFDLPHSYEPDGWEKQYGPTDNDARHRLAINAIFDLPFGIQMSGIFYYRSATPYTAYEGYDVNKDGLLDDYVGDEYRNSRRGFDQSYFNARLSKFVNIDRLRFQFFAELFNVFNKANFYNIEDDIRQDNFGVPLSAGDPRLIQFGVRLDF